MQTHDYIAKTVADALEARNLTFNEVISQDGQEHRLSYFIRDMNVEIKIMDAWDQIPQAPTDPKVNEDVIVIRGMGSALLFAQLCGLTGVGKLPPREEA